MTWYCDNCHFSLPLLYLGTFSCSEQYKIVYQIDDQVDENNCDIFCKFLEGFVLLSKH